MVFIKYLKNIVYLNDCKYANILLCQPSFSNIFLKMYTLTYFYLKYRNKIKKILKTNIYTTYNAILLNIQNNVYIMLIFLSVGVLKLL